MTPSVKLGADGEKELLVGSGFPHPPVTAHWGQLFLSPYFWDPRVDVPPQSLPQPSPAPPGGLGPCVALKGFVLGVTPE